MLTSTLECNHEVAIGPALKASDDLETYQDLHGTFQIRLVGSPVRLLPSLSRCRRTGTGTGPCKIVISAEESRDSSNGEGRRNTTGDGCFSNDDTTIVAGM